MSLADNFHYSPRARDRRVEEKALSSRSDRSCRKSQHQQHNPQQVGLSKHIQAANDLVNKLDKMYDNLKRNKGISFANALHLFEKSLHELSILIQQMRRNLRTNQRNMTYSRFNDNTNEIENIDSKYDALYASLSELKHQVSLPH